MAKTISETTAVIIGSLGREGSVISCKSGHSFGRVVTIEATIALEESDSNLIKMEVILGERNKEINKTNDPPIPHKERAFRFGRKGLLMV